MGMLLQIIVILMGSDICDCPIQIPTKAGLPSGHVLCYSHEINLSQSIQVDLHNCNCNCVVGQAPNTALFSPLPNLVTRIYCVTSLDCISSKGKPTWARRVVRTNTFTRRNVGVYREGQELHCILLGPTLPHTVIPGPLSGE